MALASLARLDWRRKGMFTPEGRKHENTLLATWVRQKVKKLSYRKNVCNPHYDDGQIPVGHSEQKSWSQKPDHSGGFSSDTAIRLIILLSSKYILSLPIWVPAGGAACREHCDPRAPHGWPGNWVCQDSAGHQRRGEGQEAGWEVRGPGGRRRVGAGESGGQGARGRQETTPGWSSSVTSQGPGARVKERRRWPGHCQERPARS